MCGIAGIISPDTTYVNNYLLKKMADTLAHRGPDGEGYWISKQNNAGFAHRRLAIIDLTQAASQPMHYMQRYSIVYNGEIYNYPELKNELKKSGYSFNSGSDTEVILAAYDFYKEKCLQHFDGMFSFAMWDEKEQQLFCARDRFGEKPFYYYTDNKLFCFASEMKALWKIGISKIADNKLLLNYLSLGHVQNPSNKSQTFYKNIYSLPPAHYAVLSLKNMELVLHPYWHLDKNHTQKIAETDAISITETLLKKSIVRRLRSDVPVGSSLSGGLDSSSIAHFVYKLLDRVNETQKFNTFSAIFPGFEKDESKYIRQLTESMKLRNYSVTPNAKELIDDFEKICYHQEEPFPSSSIFAQYKVYGLAKAHGVKVLLDGQGADETMGGYHRYLHWYLQELMIRYKFADVKKEKHLMLQNHAQPHWGIRNVAASFLPSHASIALEKKEYNRIMHNTDVTKALLAHVRGHEWEGIHKPVVTKLNDILHFNTTELGLEELLRYADRNSMTHGVEIRLPFLNAELVKFIFSLSSDHKIKSGYTKSILRKVMNDKLPDSIVWRKDKVGFEPPQKSWMQQDIVKDFLYEAKKKLVAENILKESVLHKKENAAHAHEVNNYDWRYLCAAQMMK